MMRLKVLSRFVNKTVTTICKVGVMTFFRISFSPGPYFVILRQVSLFSE